jgi:MYXO-CTERM domain-containing protein
MLNGQRCDPTLPFACTSMEWAPGVAPEDATTDAFLYALRVNALTYDQLFDAMATYISCTYGGGAYEEFNAIACNHGIRGCQDPAPLVCETCGNGVREGNETCDGTDWLVTHCEDLPTYSEGALTCNQATCTLDSSGCEMAGLDTTAGTGTPPFEEEEGPTSTTTGADTETEGMRSDDEGGSDGCGCRATPSKTHWLVMLGSLAALGARRRRRV